MRKFVKNGVQFTSFEHDGEVFLCTGSPTGEFKFDFAGEVADVYRVIGATSVVSGRGKTIDELYADWLDHTAFYRSIGIQF